MHKRANLTFVPSKSDPRRPITKFGGQPVWLEKPQWPISRELGKPMRFLCQIALDERLFPGADGKLAYIFMTDELDEHVDDTWKAAGGENAVIIQPGGKPPPARLQPVATGPTLYRYVRVRGKELLQPKDVVFTIKQKFANDAAFIADKELRKWDEDKADQFMTKLAGTKIGGTPGFLQRDEFPRGKGPWRLLLQLQSADVPFDVNFGDAGTAFVFIDAQAQAGRMIWQSY